MGFLDKVLKDVEEGAGRAQFEMDKQAKLASLRGEIEKLKQEQRELLAEIGEEAVALYVSGQIALPGLSMQIARLQEVREKIGAQEAALAAVQASRYMGGQPAPATSAAATSPAMKVVQPAICPRCGAKLPPKVTFCPSCGARQS